MLFLLRRQTEAEFLKLGVIDGGGGFIHNIAARIVLRECDNVADCVLSGKNRYETVEAEGESAVRGRAILECVHKESELFVGALRGEAQKLEHLILKFGVVDTYGAASELGAVDDDIIGRCADIACICAEHRDILRIGGCEGVMHRIVTLSLLIPFEEGEVHDPEGGEYILVAQTETVAHLKTQLAKLLAGLHGLAGENEEEIAGFGSGTLAPFAELLLGVEFTDRALHGTILLEFNPNHTLGSDLRTLHEVSELVELLAGVSGTSGSADTDYGLCIVGHAESLPLGEVGEVDKLHSEADIGFVAAVEAHCVGPGHAGERLGEVDTLGIFENVFHEPLEHLDDILLLHEAHLAVDLGEFRLAVGAQVFIAETFGDLEISVVAADHEELLEELRRLGECIELAGVHSGGHHEVACALGSGLHENRGFDFQEALRVEITTDFESHLMAQLEILAHAGTAEVKISVFHAEVVAAVGVVLDSEGGDLRTVEHIDVIGHDLDVARGEVGILRGTLLDLTFDFHHKLATQRVGFCEEFGIQFLIEHYLCDAISVAQVKESHATHLAHTLHPSGQSGFTAGVGEPQLAASSVSKHVYTVSLCCVGEAGFGLPGECSEFKRTKLTKKLHIPQS